jgi:hypothetical protein
MFSFIRIDVVMFSFHSSRNPKIYTLPEMSGCWLPNKFTFTGDGFISGIKQNSGLWTFYSVDRETCVVLLKFGSSWVSNVPPFLEEFTSVQT